MMMDAAIEAHFADEAEQRFMTAYALIIAGSQVDEEGTMYYKVFSEDLPYDRTLGLAKYLLMSAESDGWDAE